MAVPGRHAPVAILGLGLVAWTSSLPLAGALRAQTRLEATPLPYEPPRAYPKPLRLEPAPGYFRPRRRLAGWVAALAEPPSARWPVGRARGAWIEPPDRPAAQVDALPYELYAGDRVHTGPTGAARVELPGGARVDLGSASILRLAGEGPERTPKERVRLGLERGRLRVATPVLRPLELEVPFGLVHLYGSELLVDVPEVHPRPESATPVRILVSRGKAVIHGRGPFRDRALRVGPGQVVRWTEPDPDLWLVRPAPPAEATALEASVRRLERQARAPAPEPATTAATPAPSRRPRPMPRPDPLPTLEPFLPPIDAAPTGKPPPDKDPFAGDPFDEPF